MFCVCSIPVQPGEMSSTLQLLSMLLEPSSSVFLAVDRNSHGEWKSKRRKRKKMKSDIVNEMPFVV